MQRLAPARTLSILQAPPARDRGIRRILSTPRPREDTAHASQCGGTRSSRIRPTSLDSASPAPSENRFSFPGRRGYVVSLSTSLNFIEPVCSKISFSRRGDATRGQIHADSFERFRKFDLCLLRLLSFFF